MPLHESSVPPLRVYVRKEYLYDLQQHHGEWMHGIIVSVRCMPGSVLLFQVLFENGVLRDKIPLHAIATKQVIQEHPWHFYQLWDCMSPNFSIVEIGYLSGLNVDVILKDKTAAKGKYLWSIQWGQDATFGADYTIAEDPLENKMLHLIEGDDGALFAQPNHRLRWHEPSFITKPFPEKPDYIANTQEWSAEGHGRWATEDSDKSFYEITTK